MHDPLHVPGEQEFAAQVRARARAIKLPLGDLLSRAGLNRDYLRAVERDGGISPTLRSCRAVLDALGRAEAAAMAAQEVGAP